MKLIHISQKQLEPATHEDPKNPGVLKKVLFSTADFDPECGLRMLNYAVMQPGQAFALHSHDTLEEVFYILEGNGEITIGSETQEISSEMAVIVPKQTKHIMKNIGETPLIYLAFGAAQKDGKTVSYNLPIA